MASRLSTALLKARSQQRNNFTILREVISNLVFCIQQSALRVVSDTEISMFMSHPSYQKTLEDTLHQIEGINQETQETRNHRVTNLESIRSA